MSSVDASPTYRTASGDDLLKVGGVYLLAFRNTLEDLRSPNLAPLAVADVMRACLESENDCITLAEDHSTGEALGYVTSLANADRVWRVSLARGLPFIWLWRTLAGQYRLPLRSGVSLLADKLRFLDAGGVAGADCRARILSIAVAPAAQGRGIGRQLLDIALSRLRDLGAPCVRLEVRPDNLPARSLYESCGFRSVAQYRDSRGPWDIMVLRIPENSAER